MWTADRPEDLMPGQDVREVLANVKVNSPKLFLLRKAALGLLGENPAVVTKYTV